MSETPLVIAFKTLGNWSAAESHTLIRSISVIYNAFFVLQFILGHGPGWHNRSLRIGIEPIFRYHEPDVTLELRLSEFLQNLDQYLLQEQQLMVYRIRLGSEGIFSFTGLGEIINQVREFIKDLSFRNKKEKELKTLEITEKVLDILQQIGPPLNEVPSDLRPLYAKTIKILDCELDKLLSLESKGKLANIPENISYVPS